MSLQSRLSDFITAIGADVKALRGSISTATATTWTPSCAVKLNALTALASTVTIGAPSGTPVNGQSMLLRIKDNGTARSIGWNVIYRAVGVTRPTTTVVNKTLYLGFVYNAADSTWDLLAVGQEA